MEVTWRKYFFEPSSHLDPNMALIKGFVQDLVATSKFGGVILKRVLTEMDAKNLLELDATLQKLKSIAGFELPSTALGAMMLCHVYMAIASRSATLARSEKNAYTAVITDELQRHIQQLCLSMRHVESSMGR